MNRIITRLGLTAAAIVVGAGSFANAQTSTTGAVSGVITSGNGAVVAGATVTLISPQVTRTTTTGADGSFRLGLLNPGNWTIEVTKSGFQKASQKITVLTNQTSPFNFKLATEASAVVEVVSGAVTVDTNTTQTGMNVSMETLSSIPMGRDVSSVAFLSPGVVSGGAFGSNPSIGGGSAAENSYIVDGLSTNNMARGFQGAQLVTDFIDQVDVQTGGFKPEFSALGGVINAVTKSGSNEFKGSSWLTWDPIGIAAVPKVGPQRYFKQAPTPSRYDLGAEVGGAFIKDKLFYFAGLDVQKTETNDQLNEPNLNGLRNGKETIDAVQFLAKINWYLSQDQQFTFSLNVNDSKDSQSVAFPGTLGDAKLGSDFKSTTTNFNINYDWTISPSLFLSAKLGSTNVEDKTTPVDGNTPGVIDYRRQTFGMNMHHPVYGMEGQATGLAWRAGGIGYYVAKEKVATTQAKIDLSWFLGTHNMKFGYSYLESKYSELARTSGGYRDTITGGWTQALIDSVNNDNDPTNDVPQSIYGAKTSLYRYVLSTDATVKAIFHAIYAQDTWDIGKGVKLMFGFRYESQEQKDFKGRSFMKFNNFKDQVQPRLGLTWDVDGDGKTKVSASYAKYFEQIPQRLAIRVYANEVYTRYRYSGSRYTYSDVDGTYSINAGAKPNDFRDYATPFSFDPIAEGAKLPERNEFVVGIDHTFANGWTAGIHAKYRELKNPLEDMVFTDAAGNPYDEGPAIQFDAAGNPVWGGGAAVIGNPGKFQQWKPNPASMTLILLGWGETQNNYGINIAQYYDKNANLFTVNDTFYEKAGNKYQSIDLTLDKKTSRDTISFNYTWSRLEGNYEGVVSSSNGQADGNITASFDYYPYVGYGLMPLDRTHVAKLYASHRFDFFGGDLNWGATASMMSGTPRSKFDNTNDIGGYGNATPYNGELGNLGRTPDVKNIDMHLDWTGKFGRFQVIPSVDVFNLLNYRTPTGYLEQATDGSGNNEVRYGYATSWKRGRSYRFGVKFRF